MSYFGGLGAFFGNTLGLSLLAKIFFAIRDLGSGAFFYGRAAATPSSSYSSGADPLKLSALDSIAWDSTKEANADVESFSYSYFSSLLAFYSAAFLFRSASIEAGSILVVTAPVINSEYAATA